MEKLVYLLWTPSDVDDGRLRANLLGPTAERLIGLGAKRLRINIVDDAVRACLRARITRLDPPLAGMVSFWLDELDTCAACEGALKAVTGKIAGYLVQETVPIVNTHFVAPLGQRTPGVNVIACIERPSWLSEPQWLERWLVSHRAVAIETQCTYAYVRNQVMRSLTAGAPPWAGIVEEGFPTEAVTNPMIWYRADGDREVLERNLARMVESCKSFLDLDRVESNPMSEYRITD
jgi:hypothetical protein